MYTNNKYGHRVPTSATSVRSLMQTEQYANTPTICFRRTFLHAWNIQGSKPPAVQVQRQGS